jgi:Asp/Glu/hydantoin racemase
MPKELALIHTVTGLIPEFEALVKIHLPGWTSFNIVDESLLRHTIRDGELSDARMRRVAGYIFSAIDSGAQAILVTCSSIGRAVDMTRPFCPVPLVRVDEGMADRATETAERIGVIATLSTTLAPTRDLIHDFARRKNRAPRVVARVCEGAFERLMAGDRDGHDSMVAAGIQNLAEETDVIVLAQASMANALKRPGTQMPRVPVLTSPELGVLRLRDLLEA